MMLNKYQRRQLRNSANLALDVIRVATAAAALIFALWLAWKGIEQIAEMMQPIPCYIRHNIEECNKRYVPQLPARLVRHVH